jgi:succinate dehydrogenase hydrophobic anchor subunit
MTLSLVALFHQAALSLPVVIEDYIHSGAKYPAIIAVRMGCYGLALAGILATIRVSRQAHDDAHWGVAEYRSFVIQRRWR